MSLGWLVSAANGSKLKLSDRVKKQLTARFLTHRSRQETSCFRRKQMPSSRGAIRMICTNPSCLNKSDVWRKPDTTRDNSCKACGFPLLASTANKYKDRQAEKAKQQFRENGQY